MNDIKSLSAWMAKSAASGLLVCAVSIAAPSSPNVFVDPLDAPAVASTTLTHQPVMATTAAGRRLIAVGVRGLIIASDDAGKTWRQMASPVQSDLTSVMFPTPSEGWAVGHDGVILHSRDAGNHWVKQLDGRTAAVQFSNYYRARMQQGDASAAHYAKDIDLNFQAGPSLPYLDVWFENERQGYAVGSFGMFAATEDGGNTWRPWLDHIDNPDLLNLNAIRAIGDDVFIVGERGMVYRLDRGTNRFERLPSGYKGSFFSIAGDGRTLVAFGLRSTAFHSADRGVTWQASRAPIPATVTAVATLDDGRLIMVTSTGGVWQGMGDMDSFSPLAVPQPDSFTSITALNGGKALLGGMNGVQIQTITR